MRLSTKIALLLTLAGFVALLLASFPEKARKTGLPHPEETRPAAPRSAVERAHPVSPRTDAVTGLPPKTSAAAARTARATLKIPAVRGENNYGWVQLPHGTLVDLVRKSGREIWVRWDGTLVRIDSAEAATGAVVLRSTSPRS